MITGVLREQLRFFLFELLPGRLYSLSAPESKVMEIYIEAKKTTLDT